MIELVGITKRYPDGTEAVKDLTLTIGKGATIVLIGASGCGKSTLLKMINRLVKPTTGNIWINGVNSRRVDPVDLRRSIGYAIQEVGLFPHMTTWYNLFEASEGVEKP